MASKKREAAKQRKRKTVKKSSPKHRENEKSRKGKTKKLPARSSPVVASEVKAERIVKERVVVTLETIRGETAIGDLLVAFPWTREILVKKGLRLEAEDAGDIYMSLEAFSMMNGLNTEGLVEDVVMVARDPPSAQPVPSMLAPPVT